MAMPAPRVLIAGTAAALIGGVVWALIASSTGYEVGWIAWGIGALVGWAVARAAGGMAPDLAMPAATLAFLGVAVGKWLGFSIGGVAAFVDLIESHPEGPRAVAFQQLHDERAFAPELQAILDTLSADAELDAARLDAIEAQVDTRVASWDADTREAAVRAYAQAELRAVPVSERLRASLSLYDLLWFGLAVASAWRLAGGGQPGTVGAGPGSPAAGAGD